MLSFLERCTVSSSRHVPAWNFQAGTSSYSTSQYYEARPCVTSLYPTARIRNNRFLGQLVTASLRHPAPWRVRGACRVPSNKTKVQGGRRRLVPTLSLPPEPWPIPSAFPLHAWTAMPCTGSTQHGSQPTSEQQHVTCHRVGMQRVLKERQCQDNRRTDHPREGEADGEAQAGQRECGDDDTDPRGIESKAGPRRAAGQRRAQLLVLLVSFSLNVILLSVDTISMANERAGMRREGPFLQESDWQPEAPSPAPSPAPAPGPEVAFSPLDGVASFSSSSEQENQGAGSDEDFKGITAQQLDKVWRRFERSVISFPSSGICGTWPDAYARMHARMRAGAIPPKYITFRATPGGFPENLLGVVSAFVAALVSNRSFLIAPSANFSLGHALLSSRIDWALRDEPLNVTARHRLEVKEGDVFLLRRLNLPTSDRHRQVSFPRKPLEYFQQLAPATNIIVEANGGVLARIFSSQGPTRDALQAMGMRMPYAFGCIVRFLFRPSPEVMQRLRRPLLSLHKPGTQAVCVHARTTDALAWDLDDPGAPSAGGAHLHPDVVGAGESLLGCAKRIAQLWLPKRKPLRWLFLSDSQALGNLLRNKFPGTVLGSGIVPQHLSLHGPASLPSTVADWLLLSSCQQSVITESAFAKTALAFNLSPFLRSLFHLRGDQDGFKWRASCDGTRSSSLLEFSQLSGL